MEKREQRVRRDRGRDGKRNTFQNEQGRGTVKQQDSVVEEKKTGSQNVEESPKKNTSEDKNKTVEDDPLRFANLKRETDEIAALKAKKPHKRQVFSNWSKYEEPLPSQDESRAVDFETLLHAPQSGGFRFKSEQQWDTGSYGRFGELFTPDAELLVGGLTSLPFYERLGISKTLFSEYEIERMDSCAKENFVAYEKLSKSKPKPKIAATDLFKIDQAEKYSVVDQVNGPSVELGTSTSKPVFSVEDTPEPTPAELSLPARAAGSSAEPSECGRESTTAIGRPPEGTLQDFNFGKPPQSSFLVAKSSHSQTPSREGTPLRDGSRGAASPEFHFERAPPPSYASGNLKSPFHSREGTPAKESVPTTVPRRSSGSRAPISLGSSDGQVPSREDTSDSTAPAIREREMVQKMRDDRPTVTELTSAAGVPLEEVSPREGTLAVEQEEGGAVQETSPGQKVMYERPQVTPFDSQEVKHTLNSIPTKVEMPGREEILREHILQKNGADIQEELTYRKSPHESDRISEQKLDENGQICAENDNYAKKRGKPDVRKLEGQQRGGGRHGRRKKGQNASARGGEQLRVDAGGISGDMAEPEPENADHTAAKADALEEARREEARREEARREEARREEARREEARREEARREEARREEPHPAKGLKKKPERPPPPAGLQQDRQQSPHQQISAPTVVQQLENKYQPPLASKPEEPKAGQMSMPVSPPESQARPPQRKTAVDATADPLPKERSVAGRVDDDGLNFLMSLRGQKTVGVSEVEAAKSAAGAALSRSAIEEDEMKESQKPKPPPVIPTEKKEDLEDWLDSMLDD